jgi:sec-independent protein translocase protein TatC
MERNLLTASEFKFRPRLLETYDVELPFLYHIEELRQRLFQSIYITLGTIGFIFLNVQTLVELLEKPVAVIKFIQLSPGDYLVSTIKISLYIGILLCVPIFLSQIIFYTTPGLTAREKTFIFPLILISFILVVFGINFSYYILIPAALKFFIDYSANVIEPLWSFDQYLDFTILIFYSTGLAFQIPIVQILLGFTGVISGKMMLSGWKYVVLGSTIVGAILTPSTDPITQLCLAGAILLLYLFGCGILFLNGK